MAYKFDDHFLKIEIEDNVFAVSVSQELGKKLTKSKGILDKLSADGCDDNSIICAAIDAQLDVVLGEGAAAKIFDGREVNAFERLSVMQYVFGEITAYTRRNAIQRGNGNAFYTKNKSHHNKRRKGSH